MDTPMTFTMTKLLRLCAAMFALAIAATACSSEPSATPPLGEPTTVPQPTPTPVAAAVPSDEPAASAPLPFNEPISLDEGFSHRDIARARAALELAAQRWHDFAPDNHVVRIDEFCECDGFSVELLTLDRNSIGRFALANERTGTRSSPPADLASVDDLFARADQLISRIEDDPSAMPTSECDGAPFSLRFDATNGLPLTVDNNTPCDGGATWISTITTIPRDGQPALVDPAGFEPVGIASLGEIDLTGGAAGLVFEVTVPDVGDSPPELIRVGDTCSLGASSDECQGVIELGLAQAEPYLVVPCANCPRTAIRIVAITGSGGPPEPVENPAAFANAVGAIDTPVEAALVAELLGSVRRVDDGFEVLARQLVADCDPIVERNAVLDIDDEGRIAETGHWYAVEWGICI